jgi:hypothetical protein
MIAKILWVPNGKSLLIVTSDSPIWSAYMRDYIIAPFGDHAVVLNWSTRKQWPKRKLSTWLFYTFLGGRKEHTPSVIFFNRFWKPTIYHFWKPFKSFKHGKPEMVEELFRKLERDIKKAQIESKGRLWK